LGILFLQKYKCKIDKWQFGIKNGCLAQTEMETPEFWILFFHDFLKRPKGALKKVLEKKNIE